MAQSAVKALMAAVQEKEGSIEKFEEQLTELQRATETLRRSKEELGKEAAEHGACIEALRQELRGLHEEQSTWQRRHKQLAVEADSRDLELARRDLKIKVSTCQPETCSVALMPAQTAPHLSLRVGPLP